MRRVKGEASFTSCSNLVFCLHINVLCAFNTSTAVISGLEVAQRQQSHQNIDQIIYKRSGTAKGGRDHNMLIIQPNITCPVIISHFNYMVSKRMLLNSITLQQQGKY